MADYGAITGFTADTVDQNGTIVTGSNTLNILQMSGLGIVGGTSDITVDGTEWIRFDFDNIPVTAVWYFVIAGDADGDATSGEAAIEAFGRNGASLGVVPVSGVGGRDVSALFNHKPLSALVVTPMGDFFIMSRAGYSPCS